MPIYEFECQKCGHVFEVSQSFRDEQPKTCPQEKCSGKLKKLFSPPAIIFKGSGFYVNDHGRSGSTGKKPSGSSSSDSAPKSDACKCCENKAGCAAES
jgi:putative FmdB family regulatory protein